MSRWLVELRGEYTAQVEIEAESEEDALAIAEDQGLPDLSHCHELESPRAVSADEVRP